MGDHFCRPVRDLILRSQGRYGKVLFQGCVLRGFGLFNRVFRARCQPFEASISPATTFAATP